jgi:hypothetical protein
VHCRNALRALRPPLAPALRAAKGVRPSALSPSPPGEFQGVRPAPLAARAVSAAIGGPVSAWQRRAGTASRWVATGCPRLRLGCQPPFLMGGRSPPYPPRARIPREQKDAGKEIPSTAPTGSCLPIGRHARAVQGRRAVWSCLASPGAVVGVSASLRPRVIARQNRPLGCRPGTGGAPAGRGGGQPGAVARQPWAGWAGG